MLPAPKGGRRSGRAPQAAAVRGRFNAARPEGRESAGETNQAARAIRGLQCCPPRRAGVGNQTPFVSSRRQNPLQCCPPRRAGVGPGDDRPARPDYRASMVPAPEGGGRARPPWRDVGRYRGPNAARRGGRESAGAIHGANVMIRCFNAARPEGRESDRRVAARRTDRRCRFNAARPEGRESVPLQRRHPLLHDGVQCCPPEGREPATWSRQAQSMPLCFNAARPEGRESAPTRKSR